MDGLVERSQFVELFDLNGLFHSMCLPFNIFLILARTFVSDLCPFVLYLLKLLGLQLVADVLLYPELQLLKYSLFLKV